ncbi:hypothetical protein CLAFUR0_12694 [Fulvia fulva]|nr:hypothetical protein CLAFUR0_12694 [Fulvia fulva]
MADNSQPRTTHSRAEKLTKLLHAYIVGLRAIQSVRDVQQFIQAICDQADHAACIEKLGCSASGLEALRKGLRFDTSIDFINGSLHNFLVYLAVPEVKRLCNGDFLKRVLEVIVSPPSLWTVMTLAQQNDELSAPAELSYAWLLLELVAIAANIVTEKTFTSSDDRALRAIGYRIEHILQTKKGGQSPSIAGPGGRHDNDFVDFRRIAIYPTEDELTSKDPPYYSAAHALTQLPTEERVAHHLDNQFRLLREDFLAELRDDLPNKARKGGPHRQSMRLSRLTFAGVHNGGERSRLPTSIAIAVRAGLERLTYAVDRKAFLKDNYNFIKHQSFGYFTDGGKLIAFGTIWRDQDLLCQDTPVVAIRTPGAGAFKRVLLQLATSDTLQFVLIDTAVLAYEPVLQCLQTKLELPLWEQILCPESPHSDVDRTHAERSLADIADQIERSSGSDLQLILSLPKPSRLDTSQMTSLLSALRQSL